MQTTDTMDAGTPRAAKTDWTTTDGDRDWRDLVRRHRVHVRRCVVRNMARHGWTPRDEEIDDLTQEVFCRLLERAARGRSLPTRSVRSYLGCMARSVVVDAIRYRCAAKRGNDVTVSLEALGSGAVSVVDPAATPEADLVAREQRRDVRRRLFAMLPDSHARRNVRIFELTVWEGWTNAEISQQLGDLKPASVATAMSRMRRRLAAAGLEAVLG